MSVCLLYDHVTVLHSEVLIPVVLLTFVAVEFLSPYFRKIFCIFRRYGGPSVTAFLQAKKYSTPMENTFPSILIHSAHSTTVFLSKEIHNYLLYFLLLLFQFLLMN
jgi:hypothetical protein